VARFHIVVIQKGLLLRILKHDEKSQKGLRGFKKL